MQSLMLNIKKYLKPFCLTLVFGIVASCNDGSGSGDQGGPYTFTINHEPGITFSDAKIKIILYGTNKTVADNSATAISETIMKIENIPSDIILTWPDNAYTLISSPPVSKKENAVFYFSVSIDENNDGFLCSNDYRQDYDKTAYYTVQEKPSGITNFYVTLITNNTCDTF